MKKISKLLNKHTGCLAIVFVVFIYILGLAVSWLCTCGIVKLITMCFGWTFSWPVATGIWLLMFLAKNVFSNNVTVKK